MSKYMSAKDMYKDMAEHYKNEFEKSKLVNIDLHLKVLELEKYNDLDQNNICDMVSMLEKMKVTKCSVSEIDKMLDKVKGF